MNAQLHLLVGLVLIHVVWILAYLTGTLLDARLAQPNTRSSALAEFVVRSATGIALWGFGAFVLGMVGFLTGWGLIALLAAFVVWGRVVHGPAALTRAFWRAQAARVGLAFGPANLALYYVGLATIVPAAFPDIDSDSVRYHLAYAAEWAYHGRIFTDMFLREPYYANNFHMIFALFDVVHAAAYVHFATWLCGALAVLATKAAIGLVEDCFPRAATRFGRASRLVVAFLLPLTIVVSPVFLRWTDTGMTDVQVEMFALIPALCAVAAFTKRIDLRWSAVCCGAFLIGMKVTLIAFFPLLAATVWVLVAWLGGTRRAGAIACAVLLLAGSPWYVRNVALDHDPIPPVVSHLLHRPEATKSSDDTALILADLKTDKSLHTLAVLPYRSWVDPGYLREYGTAALNLFLYVPLVVIAAGMLFGARGGRERALLMLCVTTAYSLVYCIMTTYLLRYMLIVEPALAASIGALLLWIPNAAAGAAIRTVLAIVTVIPSPGSWPFYDYHWQARYRGFEARYVSDNTFLERDLAGYLETERVIGSRRFSHQPTPRVLLVRVETEYYFRLAGIETVGDWFGPGRFADLQTALDNDRLADYVRHFNIAAVILNRGMPVLDSGQDAALVRGLAALGFRTILNDPKGFLLEIKN
ncbi:MAG: Dolichyl-phosphate-mannose-protein mannosyltransferase [Candidatus Eremiobacteraeota bacterium]|nr:Dolichyl-phosphate-mannose-protein mannosyltransferase [Candidatus Eremiobacteraeota bacterium]